MAEPRLEGNQLILSLEFPFHYKRLEEARNRAILSQTLEDLTGHSIDFKYELSPKEKKTSVSKDEQLKTISNIFGNVELLQSED